MCCFQLYDEEGFECYGLPALIILFMIGFHSFHRCFFQPRYFQSSLFGHSFSHCSFSVLKSIACLSLRSSLFSMTPICIIVLHGFSVWGNFRFRCKFGLVSQSLMPFAITRDKEVRCEKKKISNTQQQTITRGSIFCLLFWGIVCFCEDACSLFLSSSLEESYVNKSR